MCVAHTPESVASRALRNFIVVTPLPSRGHPQDAEEYAAENDLFYIETSAKDSTNVRELFTEIGASLCLTSRLMLAPPLCPVVVVLVGHAHSKSASEARPGAQEGFVCPAAQEVLWLLLSYPYRLHSRVHHDTMIP